jgi:hypothetical protein
MGGFPSCLGVLGAMPIRLAVSGIFAASPISLPRRIQYQLLFTVRWQPCHKAVALASLNPASAKYVF